MSSGVMSKHHGMIEITKPGTPFEEMYDVEQTFDVEWRNDMVSSSEDLS
jgi:hypothetical protein